ncbi:MAG: hypothetical protein R2862_10315 [Thermoanaerobaculia bacterium]
MRDLARIAGTAPEIGRISRLSDAGSSWSRISPRPAVASGWCCSREPPASSRSATRSSCCSDRSSTVAIAIETARLVDERTRQAELERDLEVASAV